MKTFAVLLAAAAATAVLAACPSQCSGHGRCTDNDKCECFQQTGTTWRQRVGYTGADCSQRTCPLGIAYDMLSTKRGVEIAPVKFSAGFDFTGTKNVASGAGLLKAFAKNYKLGETKSFSVRISDVTDGTTAGTADSGDQIEFQWKLSEHDSYSAPQSLLAGTAMSCTETAPCELVSNGENTADTGIFVYTDPAAVDDLLAASNADGVSGLLEGNVFSFTYDHQEGRVYEYGNSNNAHQEIECSGRGSCDGATGRCGCFDGFSGEACQRTVCPNDCSGNGVCQDLRRFASDTGSHTYDVAYDANKQMGCQCDAGFRGPDCSMIECPSGDDPMGYWGGDGYKAGDATTKGPAMDCSGRGLCDYTSGECGCFKGYFGERCEYQTNFV